MEIGIYDMNEARNATNIPKKSCCRRFGRAIFDLLRLDRRMVLRPVLTRHTVCGAMLASSPKLTLASAQCGDRLRVRHICPDCPHCVRLREMGFHDRTVVRKIADGAAIICLLLGTRLALGRELCEHVEVERLAA